MFQDPLPRPRLPLSAAQLKQPSSATAQAIPRPANGPYATSKSGRATLAIPSHQVVRPSKDVYAIYRLLLPQSDRRMYQMKEQSLANALVEAAGINKASPAAQRVMHW